MKIVQLFCLVASVAGGPQSSFPRIDVDRYVNKALKTNYPQDNRIKALINEKSPSSGAALAYVKSIVNEGLCGNAAEAYLENILSGKSIEEATAGATRAYIQAFNRGERYSEGGACAAADKAWKEARRKGGKDHVLDATLAFINAWPGVEEGNPCAVAGTNYVKAIIAGKSHPEATTTSLTGFVNAFKDLAKGGKPLKDPACLDAAKAYFEAAPQKPDAELSAAFTAFTDKIFAGDGATFDPACLAALDSFTESYAAGDDLLTSNLKSARSFFKSFVSGSVIPADSPCSAATIAYTNALQSKPSAPATAGMMAYINEALTKGDRTIHPVCAAATLAYWDAYIEQKNESAAAEAAAVAYLDTLQENPDFDTGSACGKAAEAYIAEFDK